MTFPRQQLLQEPASLLLYTYIACLVLFHVMIFFRLLVFLVLSSANIIYLTSFVPMCSMFKQSVYISI